MKQKPRIKRYCYSLKKPLIPLSDKPSETAEQKTLRDAPVVVKLTAFLVTFFTVAQRSLRSAQRATRRVSEANHKVTGMSGHPDGLD
ncbi:MAG: hypothetical protein HOL40_02180 [Cellvibrionales bacterium]|jgi:hypothetical protein|nr:hypothetical protein [Cellvibrionales bacterium]